MRFRILYFGSSILVSLALGFANEAVFLESFSNGRKTTNSAWQSIRQDITSKLLEMSVNVLNEIELEDLESIINKEFSQGLPSDTEYSYL